MRRDNIERRDSPFNTGTDTIYVYINRSRCGQLVVPHITPVCCKMQTTWMVVLTVGSLWTGGQSQQFTNLATSMGAGEESLETLREAITKKLEETGTSYDASSIIHNVLAALKSSSFPTAVANNISQRCLEDSQYYVHSLYANRSLWALQSISFKMFNFDTLHVRLNITHSISARIKRAITAGIVRSWECSRRRIV